MIQTDLHVEQLMQGLALHRFNIHPEEIKRALTPILNEVHTIGYDMGVADYHNSLAEVPLTGEPVGTIEATVEVRRVATDVKEENTCEQSSRVAPESSEVTSLES